VVDQIIAADVAVIREQIDEAVSLWGGVEGGLGGGLGLDRSPVAERKGGFRAGSGAEEAAGGPVGIWRWRCDVGVGTCLLRSGGTGWSFNPESRGGSGSGPHPSQGGGGGERPRPRSPPQTGSLHEAQKRFDAAAEEFIAAKLEIKARGRGGGKGTGSVGRTAGQWFPRSRPRREAVVG